MSDLKIKVYPNPVLSKVCKKISIVDDEIKKIISEMEKTMLETSALGLAANQIGYNVKIAMIDKYYIEQIEKKEEISHLGRQTNTWNNICYVIFSWNIAWNE